MEFCPNHKPLMMLEKYEQFFRQFNDTMHKQEGLERLLRKCRRPGPNRRKKPEINQRRSRSSIGGPAPAAP